jgi:hypothetical protein
MEVFYIKTFNNSSIDREMLENMKRLEREKHSGKKWHWGLNE